MTEELRILILEDRPADAELIVRELRKEAIQGATRQVASERDFLAALRDFNPDLILADYSLPSYDGLSALAAAQQERPPTPFLFVSGSLGEEAAIEVMQRGATDYVLKQRLARLGPAVRRALREAEERTRRQQADESLRASEERFRSVWEHSIDGMRLTDSEGRILAVNEAFCRLVHLPREKLIGQLFSVVYQGHGAAEVELYRRRFASGTFAARLMAQMRLWNSDALDIEVSSSLVESGGQGKTLLSIFRDTAERKRAEVRVAAFSELGQRLGATKTAKEAAAMIVEVADRLLGWDAFSFARFSPAEKLMRHLLAGDMVDGQRVETSSAYTQPSPPSPLAARTIAEGGQLILKEEPDRMLPGGLPFGNTSRPSASLLFVPVRHGPQVIGVLSVQSYTPQAYDQRSLETLQALADLCGGALDRITTEETLREAQEQLRQSQKMEAIGQLAGGVAHDFNNMLAVMRGNADLLLMGADQYTESAKESLKQIAAAAERAANLTRQLLAFSRKQVMQARSLVLNDVIVGLTKMLRRIIGEQIDLQCRYGAELPCVQADAGMIEQVLVNLVVNARDAMPQGGQLLITTESVTVGEASVADRPEAKAGKFVCLTVKDAGTGIAPEDQPRIFEPFFTTKASGKGTGLGLATVYGIVKQHQGWIDVSSQIGAGTSFKIFLPAIPTPATDASLPQALPKIRGGTETILLVEDESAVRLITRRMLESQGYKVYEATTAREAMNLWRTRPEGISLLLSDIVMPAGGTGRDLAEQLRAQRPKLKVIFMSGYSADAIGKDADFFQRTNSRFLQKPVSSRALLETVRCCLDEN